MRLINVDVNAVERTASNIASHLTDISTLSGEIKSIEELIRAAWQGDYVEDYIECLETTRRKVDNMGDVLLSVKLNLKNIAVDVRTAEAKLRDLMNSENGGGGGSW